LRRWRSSPARFGGLDSSHTNMRSFMTRCSGGMRELGYVEGQNIEYERRYAEGRAERFEEFAREMAGLKADVIVVVTTPAAKAAMNVTTTVPIVHPAIIDPLGAGLIDSLAHPVRNLTGRLKSLHRTHRKTT